MMTDSTGNGVDNKVCSEERDTIVFRVEKGDKDRIKYIAKYHYRQSLQAFILGAVKEKLVKDEVDCEDVNNLHITLTIPKSMVSDVEFHEKKKLIEFLIDGISDYTILHFGTDYDVKKINGYNDEFK